MVYIEADFPKKTLRRLEKTMTTDSPWEFLDKRKALLLMGTLELETRVATNKPRQLLD